MTDRRRLVQVTTTDMSLQLLLGGQLTAFAEAGYEVIGVSAAGPYVAELEDHGIIHCPLPSATRSFDPIADLRTLWDLTHLLRQLRPDIVHTHNPKPGIYGRLAAHRAGVPVVVNTVHGLYAVPEDAWARRLPVYAAERFAARYSDCELVQNIEDLEALARIGTPSSKLHLLGNGIDLDRFNDRSVMTRRLAMRARLGIAEDEIVGGVVGGLVWE
jgi:glycosyltransferase involved in cell wall biosynthesis